MTNTPILSNENFVMRNQRKKIYNKTTSLSDSTTTQLFSPQSHPVIPKDINKTTLERSIASISSFHGNTDIPPFADSETLKTAKKSKRRSKKTTKNHSNDLEDPENPWIPVISKKPNRERIPSVHEIPEVIPSSQDTSENNQKRKRRRKAAKTSTVLSSPTTLLTSESTTLLNQKLPQSFESNVACITPVRLSTESRTQPRRISKSNHTDAETKNTEANSCSSLNFPQPSVAYTHELEFIISETLGSDVIVNARTHHSGLSFSAPPPAPSSTRPLLFQNPQTSEFIQLQAQLRAKEVECQVLLDEVVRMHTDIIQLKTAALKSVYLPTPPVNAEDANPTVKRTKVKCMSKESQCEEQPVETPGSRSSDIVISTLQEEICRLANENTILSQRNTNLKNQLDVSKQRLVTTQSNLQRSSAEAIRTAELTAKKNIQQVNASLNQVQVELKETQSKLQEQDVKIKELEELNHKFAHEIEDVQQESEHLLSSNTSLQHELTVSNSQSAELLRKLTELTLEKDSAVQNEKHTSTALAEIREKFSNLETLFHAELQSSKLLKQRLTELEVEIETSRRLDVELKESLNTYQKDLETSNLHLDISNKNLADANQEIASLTSTLDVSVKELDENKQELVLANQKIIELKTEAAAVEVSRSQLQSMQTSTVNTPCESCQELSKNLRYYNEVLFSTDSALTKLQTSVSEEEVKWKKSLEDYETENMNLKKKLDLMILKITHSSSNEVSTSGPDKQISAELPVNGYHNNEVSKKTAGFDFCSSEFLVDGDSS